MTLLFFRKVFDFFVFSSLFIACCAVLMVIQTCLLFDLQISILLCGFVFCGTVASYNFHWYLIPPAIENPSRKTAWNISNKTWHLTLATTGLLSAGIIVFFLREHWPWFALIGLATFMYSAPMIPHPLFVKLRKIAIGKTIYLAMVWSLVTTFLPLIIELERLGPSQILFFINRFFFIYAICVLFDYRDVAGDRAAGIRSLITYFNEKGVNWLFWISILVVIITSCLLIQPLGWLMIVLLNLPVLVLSLLYPRAKRDFSDYLYYFVLDGLMMMSAPLVVLAKFAG